MKSQAKVMQSGFLSFPESNSVQPTKSSKEPTFAFLKTMQFRNFNQEFHYSSTLEQVLDHFQNRSLDLLNISTHSAIIKLIIDLLAKRDFNSFLELQEKNPFMSYEHLRFLQDYLGVLYEKRTPLLIPQQWSTTVSISESPSLESFQHTQAWKYVGAVVRDTLPEFIQRNFSQFGILGTLYYMQVIFGRRTIHATYGSAKGM